MPSMTNTERLNLIKSVNNGKVKLSLLSLAQYRVQVESRNHDMEHGEHSCES